MKSLKDSNKMHDIVTMAKKTQGTFSKVVFFWGPLVHKSDNTTKWHSLLVGNNKALQIAASILAPAVLNPAVKKSLLDIAHELAYVSLFQWSRMCPVQFPNWYEFPFHFVVVVVVVVVEIVTIVTIWWMRFVRQVHNLHNYKLLQELEKVIIQKNISHSLRHLVVHIYKWYII
jgi:hypothetical protein